MQFDSTGRSTWVPVCLINQNIKFLSILEVKSDSLQVLFPLCDWNKFGKFKKEQEIPVANSDL